MFFLPYFLLLLFRHIFKPRCYILGYFPHVRFKNMVQRKEEDYQRCVDYRKSNGVPAPGGLPCDCRVHLSSTFLAKLGSVFILELAFRALHLFLPPNRRAVSLSAEEAERGGQLKICLILLILPIYQPPSLFLVNFQVRKALCCSRRPKALCADRDAFKEQTRYPDCRGRHRERLYELRPFLRFLNPRPAAFAPSG